jgi:DNA-binding transcriptional ArsR family regulator|eukprot:TRINITY_DN31657_c0_g1_i1.p1 TRINITY_DN31657_c0_g1~~TRINITY_DN31657_c0_g1_i1.p1  ORF type:complete len:127 (+),score=14.84 TRINITY_DN31657_c0_g1_i1:28-381(+)
MTGLSSPYTMVLNGSGQENVSEVKIDFLNVKKAALILRALNHKLRQQMIQLLDEKQKMTVTELYVQLRLEQSVASQHLAILRRAGMVITTREGKFIYYSVNHKRLAEIYSYVEQLLN